MIFRYEIQEERSDKKQSWQLQRREAELEVARECEPASTGAASSSGIGLGNSPASIASSPAVHGAVEATPEKEVNANETATMAAGEQSAACKAPPPVPAPTPQKALQLPPPATGKST
eukprot:1267792-Pyramimonas_sp.AAC.1